MKNILKESLGVRCAIARNPSTPLAVLKTLAQDEAEDVCRAAEVALTKGAR